MSAVAGEMRLKKPITYTTGIGAADEQKTVEALVFKPREESTAGDLVAMDQYQGDMAKILGLIAQLTGQPYIVIKQLGLDDFTAAMERVEGFMPPGLVTGPTPSAT